MPFKQPQHLLETDWPADHLDDLDLRILDGSVGLQPAEDERTGFVFTNVR